jgi:hypothetical protein
MILQLLIDFYGNVLKKVRKKSVKRLKVTKKPDSMVILWYQMFYEAIYYRIIQAVRTRAGE